MRLHRYFFMPQLNGWVKLHRKIEEWEWFTDANTYRLFTYIMIRASNEEKRWQGVTVPAGGLITSVQNLSKTLRISPQSIRTSLNKLKSTNDITIKTTQKYTLIQLNNWSTYQDTNKQINKRLTNDQQTTNNIGRIGEYKNNKKGTAKPSFEELTKLAKTLTSDSPEWADLNSKMLRLGYKPYIAGDLAYLNNGEWKVGGASGWVSTSLSIRDNIEYRRI